MSENIAKSRPCHIHSLDGLLGEAVIGENIGGDRYVAFYKGVKCVATYNPRSGAYYVDDVFGVIKDAKERGNGNAGALGVPAKPKRPKDRDRER
jgi:hypothetical protein